MTPRTREEQWRLLLSRASELVGAPAERLVDEDGDVHLADSPFGVWGRLHVSQVTGELLPVFVLVPLGELQPSVAIDELVRRTLAGRDVAHEFGSDSIQLFAPLSASALENRDDFRREFEAALAIGKDLVSAVQPRFGGLTTEQSRILRGWRGVNDEIAAVLAATATEPGSSVLAHGWDPRRESPPLLISEERCEWGWARRFVTVETDGSIRLRSTIPGTRDGVRGFEFTIHRLGAGEAKRWAGRLGLETGPGNLRAEQVQTLSGRPWPGLWEAMDGLPRQSGDAWEPLES